MRVLLAALAALVATLSVARPTAAAERLTLDDAFERVAVNHPQLRLLNARAAVLGAERDRAAMSAPLVAGVLLENGPGTGEFSGLAAAELTLTLSSVLERGGKLDARRTLAQGRFDALAVERETRRLDLLAEVARRYLALRSAQLQQVIAESEVEQRQRTAAAAQLRLEAGASPESVLFAAEAALARAELAVARATQQALFLRQHLAALWGERDPRFEIEAGDPLDLPDLAGATALVELLEKTPELARFADERRLREARLQLAQASATADVEWQVGVRHHQAGDDLAVVAGLAMPLGARRRAEPEIRAASAELAQLSIERESAALSLYSTLGEAHGRYRLAQLEVQRLRDEVLPILVRAEAAAERAYRAGATSYLEWAQVQSELTATRRQQLDVATDAQRALIEIQRLTGQSFVAGPASRGNSP